ncbi:MAG: amino acid adenylation domain-containing protein [Woeseiaceae bacterium]|nr:amino acid adenylation domain-containing protein [Woeseiaceae bacterium]
MSRFADSIAAGLLRIGVERGDRVAILTRRSVASVASMHAILSVNAFYVPIGLSMPRDRIDVVLKDCEPRVIIYDAHNRADAEAAASLVGAKLLELSVSRGFIDIEESEVRVPNAGSCSSDSGGYILYTSGSTGQPKGVVISQESILDYVDWSVSYFGVTNRDRILSTAPFHFDMSVFDIFVSLISGATLVIASERECLFPRLLTRKISEQGPTIWKGVSSLFGHMTQLSNLDSDALSSLRILIFAGEKAPTRFLIRWMQALPDAQYFNAYGPTEATGISSCYRIERVPKPDDELPIGTACTNTRIYLFDGDHELTERCAVGEIVIGGPGVALGYWRDSARTAESFVTHIGSRDFGEPVYRTGDLGRMNDDGDLVFVARVDRQIKHQGYRIELDEIESALQSLEGVVAAAVIHVTKQRQSELVGFFEAENTIAQSRVRQLLAERLPLYMVPKELMQLTSIPRTDRGKIDYGALEAQCKT